MFIAKSKNKIVMACKTKEEFIEAVRYLVYDAIEETDKEYTLFNGEFLTPEEIEVKEQEIINNLKMTALDFINVLKSTGLTAQQIEDYLNANIDLKQQLTYCQNVYCGIVRQLLPIELDGVEVTDDIIVNAFKAKNKEPDDASI